MTMAKGPASMATLVRRRYARDHGPAASGSEEAAVPWTFNQILQPIILVLTFVILTQILGYREAFTIMLKGGRQAPTAVRGKINMINYQYQKLHVALEQAKARTRVETMLASFPNAARVKRDGSKLDDADFKKLCTAIKGLTDNAAFSERAALIYTDVLARAGVTDPKGSDFRPEAAFAPEGDRELSPRDLVDNPDLARRLYEDGGSATVISSWNRSIIQKAIVDFLDGLQREGAAVQFQLISALKQEALDDPDSVTLSDDSKRLLDEMLRPGSSDADRQRLARDFYWNLTREWEAEFTSSGYEMIIWQDLKL